MKPVKTAVIVFAAAIALAACAKKEEAAAAPEAAPPAATEPVPAPADSTATEPTAPTENADDAGQSGGDKVAPSG